MILCMHALDLCLLKLCVQVNITFATLEKKPGDNVTVTVTATPDSYVGVAAVDYSVALLADTNDITQSEVRGHFRILCYVNKV